MKRCRGCNTKKKLDDFTRRRSSKDGRNARCRDCTRQYTRKHYKDNKDFYIKKAKKRSGKLKEECISYVRSLKENTTCADCNNYYPFYMMDFDHLRDKKFNISQRICGRTRLSVLKEEISKCEIVCSNCHRARTWNRLHNEGG